MPLSDSRRRPNTWRRPGALNVVNAIGKAILKDDSTKSLRESYDRIAEEYTRRIFGELEHNRSIENCSTGSRRKSEQRWQPWAWRRGRTSFVGWLLKAPVRAELRSRFQFARYCDGKALLIGHVVRSVHREPNREISRLVYNNEKLWARPRSSRRRSPSDSRVPVHRQGRPEPRRLSFPQPSTEMGLGP